MKALKSRGRAGRKAKTTSKATSKAKPKATSKATSKAKPKTRATSKAKSKPSQPRKRAKVVLLSGGNPQIAKGDGDGPVQAYIAAMPGWKSEVGKRLDALIVKNVPKVQKAVKWNSPLYGVAGRGWFLGHHTFAHYVKVTFFRGASLRPVPPDASKDKHTRYVNLREGEFDEAQLTRWVKQAAALPGWVSGRSP